MAVRQQLLDQISTATRPPLSAEEALEILEGLAEDLETYIDAIKDDLS